MNIIEILALIVFIMILLVFFALYAHGKAYEWMTDPRNVKNLQKHYSQEGINTFTDFRERCVEVSFHHEGQYYSRSISFVNAMAYMEKTPNGGIKKLLVKKLK
ncbi:hypothetical protein PQB73_gp012 [Cronobacter phage LPCS28]|uniref:Uncharacterized protein n=1 Tax=Cronobacter phage LPCS28 TaxID=2924885 RepID=A0AAE9GCT1_9CAUD|nr:hypothetical protein PQB73_gp012 [Cronobacter phage LPCS28]UNY46919.1 hypothetical protein EHEKIMEA_00012 [Cronobacter phage LPCS28]